MLTFRMMEFYFKMIDSFQVAGYQFLMKQSLTDLVVDTVFEEISEAVVKFDQQLVFALFQWQKYKLFVHPAVAGIVVADQVFAVEPYLDTIPGGNFDELILCLV
jgi:hypothetical protein